MLALMEMITIVVLLRLEIDVIKERKRHESCAACSEYWLASAGDDNIATTPVISSEISRLQVDQLSTIVHNQKLTISSRSNQLKFVLSFLGITDGELASTGQEAVADADNTDNVGHSTDVAARAGARPVIADGASDTDIASQQSNHTANQNNESEGITYARVTASNSAIRMNDGSGQPNSLREAVAAAMYVDQRDKERRAKSVVVSGLAPSADNSDAVIFQRLCWSSGSILLSRTHTDWALSKKVVSDR